MRKLKTTFIFAAVLAFFAVIQGGTSIRAFAASDTVEVSATYKQTEARTMLSMINEFRTGSDAWYWNSDNTTKTACTGLSELTYDYDLEKVAMQRAVEIALSFSHTRPDGTICTTAYGEMGYSSYSACGENIAAGYTSVQSAFTAFQETDCDYEGQGHRRNMLDSKYNVCAFACVYYNGCYYWAQEFARTTKSSSSTTANDSKTTVDVTVSADQMSSCTLTASPESITLVEGGSASLPNLTVKICFTNAFPKGSGFSAAVSCTWTAGDSACASADGGKVTAKAVGDTKLTATFLGQTVQVPVYVRKDLSKCSMSLDTKSCAYDGSAKKPAVTVKDGSTVLKKNTDYTIAYSSNKNIGTATVTVTGTGSYSGTLSKTFKITVSKGAGYTVGDLVYQITSAKINGKGTVAVTGPAGRKLTSAAVPATVKIGGVKFKVTAVGAQAFKDCTKLKSVSIGRNVTRIGKKAFYNCKKLRTITIKSRNLSSVGKKAFKGIHSSAKIVVPKSKLSAYRELLAGKGQGLKVQITK